MCSPAIFQTCFSYENTIWIAETDYYMYFYTIVVFPLTAILQLINFTATINLINVYAPTHDDPGFFNEFKDLAFKRDFDYIILCGDLNLVLDPKKDSHSYNVNNPKARTAKLELIDELDLLDIYRILEI